MDKNYGGTVLITDELETHALDMADMMSEGIIKQFPQRFPFSRR